MITNPPLGDERHTGTLRAFKAALITADDDSGVTFRGVGLGTSYGPADAAVCVSDAEHVPPHPGCGCGFYAWKDRADAI